MEYQFKNGKYIICKDGVYFSVSSDQLLELMQLVGDMYAHHKLLGTQDKSKSKEIDKIQEHKEI